MTKFLFILAFITATTSAFASHHKFAAPADLQWGDAPPFLPAGAKVAVIDGDPMKKGPFVMRLKFPPNYAIKPHWHLKTENITVIEGQPTMGTGEKMDPAMEHALPPEAFAMMPAKEKHYLYTKDQEVIVQLHGEGPFDITYVNPTDDPRKQKK